MSVLCALKQPGNTVKANVGGSIRREPWVNANCSTVYIKRQIKLAFCCQKSSCLQCYFVNKKNHKLSSQHSQQTLSHMTMAYKCIKLLSLAAIVPQNECTSCLANCFGNHIVSQNKFAVLHSQLHLKEIIAKLQK